MGIYDIEGGYDTLRAPHAEAQAERLRRERRDAKARANLKAFAADRFPGDEPAARVWLAETLDMPGLADAEPKHLCKGCRKPFTPGKAGQRFCGLSCSSRAAGRARAVAGAR